MVTWAYFFFLYAHALHNFYLTKTILDHLEYLLFRLGANPSRLVGNRLKLALALSRILLIHLELVTNTRAAFPKAASVTFHHLIAAHARL